MSEYSLSTMSSEQLGKFINKARQISMIHYFNLQVERQNRQGQKTASDRVDTIPYPL